MVFGIVAILALGLLAQCRKAVSPAKSLATPAPSLQVTAWPTPSAQVEASQAPSVAGTPAVTATGPVTKPKRVRSLVDLTEEERARFRQLEAKFWATKDQGARLEILDEIDGASYGPEFLAMAAQILALHDEALSLRAIDLLDGNTSVAILGVLGQALNDGSPQVRQQAVLAARQVRDDAVVEFFGKAFEDPEANVRLSGFNALDEQPSERRIKVLAQALETSQADVQRAGVDLLQLESTPRSLEPLFSALDAPNAGVRDAAQFSLEFQLDQKFPNAAAARAWWSANRDRYDQNLAPK